MLMCKIVVHFFRLYPLILLLFLTQVSSLRPHNVPRLSPYFEAAKDNKVFSASAISNDYKTYYYDQTLDHFNYGAQSYTSFKQRYVVNSKYWGGANSNSPIFAYLGEESPIDYDLQYTGFLNENAPSFKALQVYIEHRYYGKSIPFGSLEKAMKNDTTRGYFNSAQAMADYAEVLLHVKKKFSAENSPIIVFGGSYGGMLASWFRLKYPHIALGALASSAPILYFENITPQNGYYSVVTKVFKDTSKTCYQDIKKSWDEIDRVASKPNGLTFLSRKFKTCTHLNDSFELKDYLDSMYTEAAQYNLQPDDFVRMVCNGIDRAPKGTDLLGRIFAGVVSFREGYDCYYTKRYINPGGWDWQMCSEMVMPIGKEENDTMFFDGPFNLNNFINGCKSLYGVPPRPHWVTTYYGGHDIRLVLHRFGSNIIFSNGLKDPYSSGGVLEDISESVLAVSTVNGSHCMDISSSSKSDPEWLVVQRNEEIKIIERWITKYYDDLKALKQYK